MSKKVVLTLITILFILIQVMNVIKELLDVSSANLQRTYFLKINFWRSFEVSFVELFFSKVPNCIFLYINAGASVNFFGCLDIETTEKTPYLLHLLYFTPLSKINKILSLGLEVPVQGGSH